MSQGDTNFVSGVIVEEQVHLNLFEFCQACSADQEHVLNWVFEGVLEPAGESPEHWRFGGESLRRARLARRLSCDLEINPPGIALALDLLDQIAALHGRLRRLS